MRHPWRGACVFLLTLLALSYGQPSLAQETRAEAQAVRLDQRPQTDARKRCWSSPSPETVEEALKVAQNPAPRERRQRATHDGTGPDLLLLSGGTLKAAYAAGLLVGWEQTGLRPRFGAITAAGMSALIAPFVFIGPAGDQIIADIFNCTSTDLIGLAGRAASYLDDDVLNAIAREHEGGRRLLIALTGSAARAEVVWDIGRLATSRHADTAPLARQILLAAVDQHSFVDPKGAPTGAGETTARNFTFRVPGAGEPFLFPPDVAQISGTGARTYLIHNAVLFTDESADYIRGRNSADHAEARAILPAYDIVRHLQATGGGFRFASIKERLGLIPLAQFDMDYLKALFLHAFRRGRMGEEWTSAFPGLPHAAAKPLR